jgi:hypothetical protein
MEGVDWLSVFWCSLGFLHFAVCQQMSSYVLLQGHTLCHLKEILWVIFGSCGGDLVNLLSYFIVNKNCYVAELVQ